MDCQPFIGTEFPKLVWSALCPLGPVENHCAQAIHQPFPCAAGCDRGGAVLAAVRPATVRLISSWLKPLTWQL